MSRSSRAPEGAGIGWLLIDAVAARASSARIRLIVITTSDNIRAHRFYQRAGFA